MKDLDESAKLFNPVMKLMQAITEKNNRKAADLVADAQSQLMELTEHYEYKGWLEGEP